MSETINHSPNQDVRPVLGRLMSGEEVIDRPNSHLHSDPQVIHRALAMIDSRGERFVKREVYMGEQVGYSDCVKTNANDQIVYASRPGRPGPTRFVMGREPEPTDTVSAVLLRDDSDDQTMILISAWTGNLAEPEPWDRNATPASANFWANHALVWGSQEIDGTKPVTKE